MTKKNIIIVGAFKESSDDGTIGGQLVACNLLVSSPYGSDKIEWIKIDSTLKSVPPPNLLIRSYHSFRRVLLLLILLIFKRNNGVFLMASSGFSFYEKGVMVFICNLFRKKVVISPRSGDMPRQIGNSWFFRNFVIHVFKRATYIMCQSEYWKNYYSSMLNSNYKQSFVVQENWIAPVIVKKKPKRERVGILFLARIEIDKGIVDFMEALEMIPEVWDKIHVDIAGGGKQFENLKNWKAQLVGNISIQLHGFVKGEAKTSLLSNSDIMVFPSYFEGYPNTLLEAKNNQMAIIATNIPAIRAVVENEKTGLLVPTRSPDRIAKSIIRLINDSTLRNRLASNALLDVKAKNSVDFAIDKIVQLYE